ncbi:RNA-directed DNA polymerase from mobile element jockey-like [Elysia marginata]|uniref:RNA-directed DNA polymerase from mobile element jockey-like n=1 Tax=Elysia marginata TaxID=1093978 RepID=A0AAV4GZZ8_9GAST|nr:RNA-directed DNA polymerase from mobile element jockey-like [Elysia marginata]
MITEGKIRFNLFYKDPAFGIRSGRGFEAYEVWESLCIYGINTEMLKALGDFGIEVLTNLCNCMYSTAYIPEDLKTSVFILLPKKPKATDCSDYRTISLMCHILKLLLSIIMQRMSQKIERETSDRQTGFRKNSGTREAIFSLKVTAERYLWYIKKYSPVSSTIPKPLTR